VASDRSAEHAAHAEAHAAEDEEEEDAMMESAEKLCGRLNFSLADEQEEEPDCELFYLSSQKSIIYLDNICKIFVCKILKQH